MKAFNRAARRKMGLKIVNDAIKDRAVHDERVAAARKKALAKKQWGLGLVVTNLMAAVIIGPWSFTLFDRRAK